MERKYMMIFLLSSSLFLNGEIWTSLPSITPNCESYFKVTSGYINWFSNVFTIALFLEAIPSLYFPNYFRLRNCIIIGSILHFLGTGLRITSILLNISPYYQYIVCLCGTIFAALAQGFLLNLPTFLTFIWFKKKQRNTYTSIAFSANFLGVASGFFLSNSILRNHDILNGLKILFLVELSLSIFILISSVIFAKDAPPNYSTNHPENEKINSIKSFFKDSFSLLRNFNILLKLITYGLYYSSSTMFYTFFSEFTEYYIGINSNILAYASGIAIISGAIFTFLIGYSLSRFTIDLSYFFGTVLNIFCFVLLFLMLILAIRARLNIVLIYCITIMYGSFAAPYNSFGLERLSINTYPIKPYVSCTLALVFGNVFSCIFIYSLMNIIQSHKHVISLCIATTSYFVCFILEIYTCINTVV